MGNNLEESGKSVEKVEKVAKKVEKVTCFLTTLPVTIGIGEAILQRRKDRGQERRFKRFCDGQVSIVRKSLLCLNFKKSVTLGGSHLYYK